jgi:hypothetical protein
MYSARDWIAGTRRNTKYRITKRRKNNADLQRQRQNVEVTKRRQLQNDDNFFGRTKSNFLKWQSIMYSFLFW